MLTEEQVVEAPEGVETGRFRLSGERSRLFAGGLFSGMFRQWQSDADLHGPSPRTVNGVTAGNGVSAAVVPADSAGPD
ncbi:hypothetical protein AB0L10_25880 [Streptomyces flaveolus]|uniref:hypothetical protein n=1 Tax=Streptomyces flaveolus TaxID=67297 RepID=UPI0034426F13